MAAWRGCLLTGDTPAVGGVVAVRQRRRGGRRHQSDHKLLVLQEVDENVDRTADSGQQVGDVADTLWDVNISIEKQILEKEVPKYLVCIIVHSFDLLKMGH